MDQPLFRFNKLDVRRLKQQSNEVVMLSTEVKPCGSPKSLRIIYGSHE